MQFSEDEIRLIKKAENRIKQSYYFRIASIFILLALIVLFFLNIISSESLAIGSVSLVIVSILFPQLGTAPKYEQLVKMLSKIS
mgnify:CR=1 FL=1